MTRLLPVLRPLTRGDCANVPRPCPFEACRYHLASPAGESCAIDVADRGEHTLAEVGTVIGVTRERVRQIIQEAAAKLERLLPELLQSSADDLSRPWSSAPGSPSGDEEWFDGEFKAAVAKAYKRIVPPEERGKKMLQSAFGQAAGARKRRATAKERSR